METECGLRVFREIERVRTTRNRFGMRLEAV